MSAAFGRSTKRRRSRRTHPSVAMTNDEVSSAGISDDAAADPHAHHIIDLRRQHTPHRREAGQRAAAYAAEHPASTTTNEVGAATVVLLRMRHATRRHQLDRRLGCRRAPRRTVATTDAQGSPVSKWPSRLQLDRRDSLVLFQRANVARACRSPMLKLDDAQPVISAGSSHADCRHATWTTDAPMRCADVVQRAAAQLDGAVLTRASPSLSCARGCATLSRYTTKNLFCRR